MCEKESKRNVATGGSSRKPVWMTKIYFCRFWHGGWMVRDPKCREKSSIMANGTQTTNNDSHWDCEEPQTDIKTEVTELNRGEDKHRNILMAGEKLTCASLWCLTRSFFCFLSDFFMSFTHVLSNIIDKRIIKVVSHSKLLPDIF